MTSTPAEPAPSRQVIIAEPKTGPFNTRIAGDQVSAYRHAASCERALSLTLGEMQILAMLQGLALHPRVTMSGEAIQVLLADISAVPPADLPALWAEYAAREAYAHRVPPPCGQAIACARRDDALAALLGWIPSAVNG